MLGMYSQTFVYKKIESNKLQLSQKNFMDFQLIVMGP